MFKKVRFEKLNILIVLIFTVSLALSTPAYALRDSEIPNLEKVKKMIVSYRESGDWQSELEAAAARGLIMLENSRDRRMKQAVVFDIDETTIDNYEYYSKHGFAFVPKLWFEWVDSAKAPAIPSVKKIYDEAVKKGVRVIFITGRTEQGRASTELNLKNAGYLKYDKLIMRTDAEKTLSALEYKSKRRADLERNYGYQIILNVGDQHSDLLGGHSKHIIKLPNPMYYIP